MTNDWLIALERINLAQKNGHHSLDLSDLFLTDIPDELFELKYLKELLLGENLMEMKHRIRKILTLTNAKTQQYLKITLGQLGSDEVERIRLATGFQLNGFTRVIDKYGIIHALSKHGNPLTEMLRGQVAIVPADFEKIMTLVNQPNEIVYGETNKKGNELIKYKKEMEDEIYYVEEIRMGRREVAFVTLFKRKNR